MKGKTMNSKSKLQKEGEGGRGPFSKFCQTKNKTHNNSIKSRWRRKSGSHCKRNQAHWAAHN